MFVTRTNINVEPSYTEVTQRLFSPFIRADAKCHVNEKLVPAKRANQDTCDGQNKRERASTWRLDSVDMNNNSDTQQDTRRAASVSPRWPAPCVGSCLGRPRKYVSTTIDSIPCMHSSISLHPWGNRRP